MFFWLEKIGCDVKRTWDRSRFETASRRGLEIETVAIDHVLTWKHKKTQPLVGFYVPARKKAEHFYSANKVLNTIKFFCSVSQHAKKIRIKNFESFLFSAVQ